MLCVQMKKLSSTSFISQKLRFPGEFMRRFPSVLVLLYTTVESCYLSKRFIQLSKIN